MKKIYGIAVLFVLNLLVGCGNTTADTTSSTNTIETTEVTEMSQTTEITETTQTTEVTEEVIVKGSKKDPYVLGETAILEVYSSGLLGEPVPATIEIVFDEYDENYVKCEVGVSNFDSDAEFDLGLAIYTTSIDSNLTEEWYSQITVSPENTSYSPGLCIYDGGRGTGYIELENTEDGVDSDIKYVVLKYYGCTNREKPQSDDDWTTTWFLIKD